MPTIEEFNLTMSKVIDSLFKTNNFKFKMKSEQERLIRTKVCDDLQISPVEYRKFKNKNKDQIVDPQILKERKLKIKEYGKQYRAKKKTNPFFYLQARVYAFQQNVPLSERFTYQDVINKFGEKPICFYTGKQLDFTDPNSFSLDHYIPKSRGGDSSLDNLRITTLEINTIKNDLLPEEFIQICKTISIRFP